MPAESCAIWRIADASARRSDVLPSKSWTIRRSRVWSIAMLMARVGLHRSCHARANVTQSALRRAPGSRQAGCVAAEVLGGWSAVTATDKITASPTDWICSVGICSVAARKSP